MLSEHFDKIAEVLEDEGIDHEIRDDYSGRGMYGKTCRAFIVDSKDVVVWALGKAGLWIDDVGLRTDNMGRDRLVVY